jgi:predicted RNA binding protein YcfA (HicA-like mRNA interferase family)
MGKLLCPEDCRSSSDFVRYSKQQGASIAEGGSHTKIVGPTGGKVPIPRHRGDLPEGTRRSIIRMLKMIGVASAFIFTLVQLGVI